MQPTVITTITPLCGGGIQAGGGNDPKFLDTNFQAIACPSVYIGEAAGGEGILVGIEGFA